MSDSKEPLGRLIYLLAQDIRKIAEKVLIPHDLTLEQLLLLKNMPVDSGITQSDLGKIANKTPANITRMLDRLEAKALIARRTDPGDRRACLILLTNKGRTFLEGVKEVFETFSAMLHKGISREMQGVVRNAMEIMTSNIETISHELKRGGDRCE